MKVQKKPSCAKPHLCSSSHTANICLGVRCGAGAFAASAALQSEMGRRLTSVAIIRHMAMARYRPDAFPCCRPWQDCAPMRSRAAGHGRIAPRCVPRLPAMARLCPDAFPKGPRTGKAPVRGNISPACIQIQLILARYACHASEKPRKVPLGNTPREHLAAKGRFRRPKPSDHARRTNLATLRWPCP